MIRFAWLQSRTQTAIATGALAIVAIGLAITGPQLIHLYNTTVATCTTHGDCSTATTAFLDADGPLQVFAEFLLLVVPVLIGMFWGAPLVAREFETGTYRLAWTQSVTRTRWLAFKLGLGALTSIVVGGLLSLMVTWWFSRTDLVRGDRFSSLTFSVRDIAPIGYAAFAFALGVTAGLLTRRTLPAMVTALIGFVGTRVAIASWVRPSLITPLHKNVAINRATNLIFGQRQAGVTLAASTRGILPGDWVYSNQIVDRAGQAPTTQFLDRVCPQSPRGGTAPSCIAHLAVKFHEVIRYQPANRYWAFQWGETAIFLGLAIILSAMCLWWIRRPIA